MTAQNTNWADSLYTLKTYVYVSEYCMLLWHSCTLNLWQMQSFTQVAMTHSFPSAVITLSLVFAPFDTSCYLWRAREQYKTWQKDAHSSAFQVRTLSSVITANSIIHMQIFCDFFEILHFKYFNVHEVCCLITYNNVVYITDLLQPCWFSVDLLSLCCCCCCYPLPGLR